MATGYNLYDKPLFQGSSAASIYRPKSNMDAADGDAEMNKVLKSKTKFAGAHGDDLRPEDDAQTSSNGPIQFERQAQAPPKAQPDVFGIDKFLSDSSKKRSDRYIFFCFPEDTCACELTIDIRDDDARRNNEKRSRR